MIYDCFMFNNELDLLELRLNHHSAFVDRFIIIESTRTYNGADKLCWFNRLFYKELESRIYYIQIDFPFNTNENWQYEHLQRNMLRGFTFKKDDIIIYSDCDEIIRDGSVLKRCKQNAVNTLQMDLCFYYFNLRLKSQKTHHEEYHLNSCFKNKWHMAKILPAFMLDFFENIYGIRQHNIQDPDNIIENAGWHFSNLGSPERIFNKMKAISHWGEPAFQNLTAEKIAQFKEVLKDPLGREGVEYEIIPDNELPPYIIKNKKRFKEYFLS